MVFRIDDVDRSPAIDSQGPRLVKATRLPPGSAPKSDRSSIPGELLHSVVAVFGDIELSRGVEGNIVRIRELPRLIASFTDRAHRFAIPRINLNPMIGGI